MVKETKAERHARGFTCWGQFVAMLFCQLGGLPHRSDPLLPMPMNTAHGNCIRRYSLPF
ncbi:MAG: DUF4372 domain-containing protein [Desulfuromonas sp.]|nr:DUF4372 domain-containing protein [Desulfuromonas sp.]